MDLDVEPPHSASHLFTIRLWRETLDATQSEWRGRVVHARSGETRYFRDWAALLAFVQVCLAEPQGMEP